MHLWGMPCSDQSSRYIFAIFPLAFLTIDDIGKPSQESNLFDEVCTKELVNFFFDGFMPLFSHLSFLL